MGEGDPDAFKVMLHKTLSQLNATIDVAKYFSIHYANGLKNGLYVIVNQLILTQICT